MKHEELKEMDQKYVAHTYARGDVSVQRGRGAVCWSEDGKRWIDFSSGIGVNALGFCDPQWMEAVGAQLGALQHVSNLYYTEPCALLAERLVERSGLRKVFFCNSGAEANECAIKTARKYAFKKYGGRRFEIITLENSFHGRTMATVSATGQSGFHKFFAPFLPGFKHTPVNDLKALEGALSDDSCAILIEMVQGEGGVIPLHEDFVKGIARICAERDLIFIADEVQTGIGRTGRLFAYEHFGVLPDIVTSAKALGGGLPIGAAILGEKCAEVLEPGDHGSTFGGNPAICAGGLAVLDRIDEAFLAELREKAEYLREKLKKIPGVKAVSGLGLMLGVDAGDRDVKAVIAACAEKGLLILSAKDRLRMRPPLIISREEIDEGLAIFEEALAGC
jgi:acetylornithine/N-succinyldiaminopimelate aminotransferase